MNWEYAKNVLTSIFIGVCVAAITALCRGILDALQAIPPEGPGSIAGGVAYIIKATRRYS